MSFKSFLNWIHNDSPGLEGAKDKIKGDWNEKRRDNRVDLPQERALTVHLMSEEAGGSAAKTLVATIRNVSVRGCGLVFADENDRDRLKIKQVLLASLAVDDFPIPLQVEVIRLVGKNEAAIKFKPPFPRELEKLEKFLEPRCLGRSLREIDPAKLQKNQQKGLRWFQGVNETHLFTWADPATGVVSQQQLIFLDRVVEWKDDGPVRTGMVRPDERAGKGDVGWFKAELMDFDARPASAVIGQARVLVESAPIDGADKTVFLEKLKT